MCDVNIATGEVTQFEFDVLLSGRMPWRLTRRYSSENPEPGVIGFGWKLNLGTFLRCGPDAIEMFVDGDSFARFPLIGVGHVRPFDDSGVAVARTDAGISVTDRSGVTHTFPCGDPTPVLILCARRYDAYRNFIEFQHDGDGRLSTILDTFNRQILFSYDGRWRLVEVYAAIGSDRWSLVRYEYDGGGDLATVVDAAGRTTRYEYAAHLLTRVTDPGGRDLYYQYDWSKKCVRTWFTGGVWDRQLLHDPQRQRVLVTNPQGHSTVFRHNGDGVVTGDTDPLGRGRDDVFDSRGRLLLSGSRGAAMQTIIRRDPGSNTVILSRNGTETLFEVNGNNQVVSMKRPNGDIWSYEYDRGGNQTRSEAPDGSIWTFDYNQQGDLVRSVDPAGYERHREVTARRRTVRDAFGLRLEEHFDVLGRPTSFVDGTGGEIRFQYDSSGNVLRRINPDGTASLMEYDSAGRPTAFTDELGRRSRLHRDPSDSVFSFARADGLEEVYEYGSMDELERIINSKGEAATFAYDAVGRCTSITYFDGRRDVFAYDDADNPIALINGRTGALIAACAYEDDELVEESYADGRRLRIAYGPSGEVVSATNSDAALSFERDAMRRIIASRTGELELRYAYDLRGDVARVAANTGRRIEYEWDGRGRLSKMTDSAAGSYEYSYDARDLVVRILMPNRCTQHFEYDASHRMVTRRAVRHDGSEICLREYSYDAAGRLISYRDTLRGTRRYEYDAVDLLRSVRDDRGSLRFQYDGTGNLITTHTGAIVGYTTGDRPIRVGGEDLEYDERGRLTLWRSPAGDSRFEYTGEGWLKRAVLADGTVAEYEYDGMARRTAKTVAGVRTDFEWDGVHLFAECTGDRRTEYLFMPGSFFPTGLTRDGRHYSYVFDQLGTPTELLDELGEIAWAADYAPHGEITELRVNLLSQPFRFLGQYADEELAWYYNRFRYYSPLLGRFMSPDPIGFAGGINLYRYAPNPVNWVDPFGLAFATPATGSNPANCDVLSKCDWGPEMMKEAKKKTKAVNQKGCDAIVTGPCDRPPDQKEFYMKNCVDEDDKDKVEASLKTQNDSCKSKQVDHIKEVQCGGQNECKNLAPLTQTVNGSFGSQIKQCRDQLAAKGVTGIVRMTITLVNIRDASDATLDKHGKKPCESDETRCP